MGVMTVSSQNFMEIDMPGWWLTGASVDLDFRNGRYYDSSDILTSLSKLLTISRASIGYAKTSGGVLTQFPTGTMRITDLGLLIEDARTNSLLDSAAFDTGNWVAPSSSITANSTAAPDGTVTADTYTMTTGGGALHTNAYTVSVAAGAAWAFSVYFKAGTAPTIQLTAGDFVASDFHAVFNTADGSLSSSGITGTAVIDGTFTEMLANGWFRIGIAGHFTSGPLAIVNQVHSPHNTIGDSFILWGAQFELGAFPSSYIPTTSTSATRASDSVTISGSAQTLINNATGSIVAWVNGSPVPVFPANIVDSNGTNLLGYDATDHGLTSITSTLTTGNTANASGRDKFGTAWDAAGRRLVLNGGTVATDAVAQTPSATQKLGSASGTSNFLYAYVDRLALWNTKLAAATLQSLTT